MLNYSNREMEIPGNGRWKQMRGNKFRGKGEGNFAQAGPLPAAAELGSGNNSGLNGASRRFMPRNGDS